MTFNSVSASPSCWRRCCDNKICFPSPQAEKNFKATQTKAVDLEKCISSCGLGGLAQNSRLELWWLWSCDRLACSVTKSWRKRQILTFWGSKCRRFLENVVWRFLSLSGPKGRFSWRFLFLLKTVQMYEFSAKIVLKKLSFKAEIDQRALEFLTDNKSLC